MYPYFNNLQSRYFFLFQMRKVLEYGQFCTIIRSGIGKQKIKKMSKDIRTEFQTEPPWQVTIARIRNKSETDDTEQNIQKPWKTSDININ